MDVEQIKSAFLEGVYKRVSEMSPEERAQVKAGKDTVLDFIGTIGAFLDVADEYVDKAVSFVDGIYVDVVDETVPQAQSAPVQPKADTTTLNHIYLYLAESENYRNYNRTYEYRDYRSWHATACNLVDFYNEVLARTAADTREITRRAKWNLSELGYAGLAE